ncbi:hypothetical protein D3C75_1162890 [compost metagenome]
MGRYSQVRDEVADVVDLEILRLHTLLMAVGIDPLAEALSALSDHNKHSTLGYPLAAPRIQASRDRRAKVVGQEGFA